MKNKVLALMALLLCTMAVNAQEKAMCVQMNDSSSTLTRVAELKKITFLSIADKGKALLVNTIGGNHATILLDDQPEVTVAAGSLIVTSKAADSPVKIEIDSIATMKFGDASSTKVSALTAGIICSLQQGTATFKGIPSNTMIKVCTIDGGIVPIPRCTGGELRLTRASLGPGIYIVRIGTFATKITL